MQDREVAGVRRAITWLHAEAKRMDDPHAVIILNNAAFHLGVQLNYWRGKWPRPSADSAIAKLREQVTAIVVELFCENQPLPAPPDSANREVEEGVMDDLRIELTPEERTLWHSVKTVAITFSLDHDGTIGVTEEWTEEDDSYGDGIIVTIPPRILGLALEWLNAAALPGMADSAIAKLRRE